MRLSNGKRAYQWKEPIIDATKDPNFSAFPLVCLEHFMCNCDLSSLMERAYQWKEPIIDATKDLNFSAFPLPCLEHFMCNCDLSSLMERDFLVWDIYIICKRPAKWGFLTPCYHCGSRLTEASMLMHVCNASSLSSSYTVFFLCLLEHLERDYTLVTA
jgi:hypothetical protein